MATTRESNITGVFEALAIMGGGYLSAVSIAIFHGRSRKKRLLVATVHISTEQSDVSYTILSRPTRFDLASMRNIRPSM